MPKMGLRESFEMETRNKYTKINCEVNLSVDGRELPSMAVLGDALELAIKLIEDRVAESYKVVPPREEFVQPEEVKPATVMKPVAAPAPAPVTPAPTEAEVTQIKPVPFG